jgi:hypothetical protein
MKIVNKVGLIAVFSLGLIAICLTGISGGEAIARAAEKMPTLAAADWSVNAPNNLAKHPPSRKEVEKLLGFGESYSVTPGGDVIQGLCSFTFANLRGTGTLSLVVVSDYSGRFCNEVTIVDKTPYGMQASHLGGFGGEASKLVKYLGHNGRYEVVNYDLEGGWQGGVYCGVSWPVVYGWTGSKYADVSAQYKDFYRRELAGLDEQIRQLTAPPSTPTPAPAPQAAGEPPIPSSAALAGGRFAAHIPVSHLPPAARTLAPTPATSSEGYNARSLPCLQAEAVKIRRFLGEPADKWMPAVIKLSKSGNSYTRDLAAQVLAEIGTPAARSRLKSMATDPDRGVAADAKALLRHPPSPPDYSVETTPIKFVNGRPQPAQ